MVSWRWSWSIMSAACLVELQGTEGKPSSVFCFTVSMPFGYEPSMLAAQAAKGHGVFECDAFQIFSNASFPKSSLVVTALDGPLESPRGGQWNSWLNAPTLAMAWERIFSEGKFRQYDWVVKLDADAVSFPGRMSQTFPASCREDPCESIALNTCEHDSMVPGPLQALSRSAVEDMASGFATCRSKLDVHNLEEDRFISKCLDLLDVPRRYNSNALLNMDCGFGDWLQGLLMSFSHLSAFLLCDCCHASFHPFKTEERWRYCHYWAHNAILTSEMRVVGLLCFIATCISFACACSARHFLSSRFHRQTREFPIRRLSVQSEKQLSDDEEMPFPTDRPLVHDGPP